MMVSNKNFLFQGTFFTCYFSFRRGGVEFLELGMCLEVGDVLLIIENLLCIQLFAIVSLYFAGSFVILYF